MSLRLDVEPRREHTLTRRYSTTEVVAMTGASYRQLDYWCRHGLVPGQPSGSIGSGRRRSWSDDDVERVRRLRVAAILRTLPLRDLVEMVSPDDVAALAAVRRPRAVGR